MIEPVRKEIRVPAEPEAAFRRFTDGIGAWWPRHTHSVSEDRCVAVRFEEGPEGRSLVEEDADGRVHRWGLVSTWEPGHRLVFSWHPGKDTSLATEVEVTFAAEAGGTVVTLEHRGWEVLGDGARETREEYQHGWEPVLAGYGATLAAAAR